MGPRNEAPQENPVEVSIHTVSVGIDVVAFRSG